MRNTGDAADTPTSTPSNDMLVLGTSADAQERAEGWKKWAEEAEKCTEIFLPPRGVDFISFIQNTTLCTILAASYHVDPKTFFPLDIASTTNALNR
ncbi:hypothetical protein AZE42_06254, partial [Rhizopogon vesiculosus]